MKTLPWFFAALALIFITLKLCDVITWSWVWVLGPIWIPPLTLILLIGLVVLVLAISERK